MTLSLLDSSEYYKIFNKTKINSNKESLILYVDFNDCYNCNLIINKLLNDVNFRNEKINLVINGVPKFKIKDFVKEFNIGKKINIINDVDLSNLLISKISKLNLNGLSSFIRVFDNKLACFYNIKELGSIINTKVLTSSYYYSSEKTLLKDSGFFFTSIDKVYGWQNHFIVLTQPNSRALIFEQLGKFKKQIFLDDSVIIYNSINYLKSKYPDSIINNKNNSTGAIKKRFEMEIKQFGFNLASISVFQLDKDDMHCLIYVRIPVEITKSKVTLDNVVLLGRLDKNFNIIQIYPVELPKSDKYVLNDASGFCFNSTKQELEISMLPIDQKVNPDYEIGIWKLQDDTYKFHKFTTLSKIDSSFYSRFSSTFNKNLVLKGFYKLGDNLKFSNQPINFSLNHQRFEYDYCSDNDLKVYRQSLEKINQNGPNNYFFTEFIESKLFITMYNEQGKIIECVPVLIDPKTKGLKFFFIDDKLMSLMTGEDGFVLGKFYLK